MHVVLSLCRDERCCDVIDIQGGAFCIKSIRSLWSSMAIDFLDVFMSYFDFLKGSMNILYCV